MLVFAVVLVAGQAAVGMRASRTGSITGDEPFYVATAQSLVSDGDLDLRDEYARGQREIERFWDGSIPLWRQMVPMDDGRLVSPHDPGLSLLIAPAYAAGGLRGAQRFLVALWAAAMACAALLARRARVPAFPSALAAIAIGAGAPGIVYASQIYPEAPAALAVAIALLCKRRPVVLAFALVALAWLGVKYVPLAALITLTWAWRNRADKRAIATTAVIATAAAAHFVWWHLHTFEGLTPYTTNAVWAGEGTVAIVADHLDVTDRLYRLHGVFLDTRFGLFRWSPVAIVAALGATRATTRHVSVLATSVLVATFASITIMGWSFPARHLVVALPSVAVLAAAGLTRVPRAVSAAVAAWSVAIGATTAWGAHHRWIRLAVDPFDLGPPLPPHWLFPDFREMGWPEIGVTTVWFIALAGVVSLVRWRSSSSSTGTRWPTGRSSPSRPTWRPLPGR